MRPAPRHCSSILPSDKKQKMKESHSVEFKGIDPTKLCHNLLKGVMT